MTNTTIKALVFILGVSALVLTGCAGQPASAAVSASDELDMALREASDYLNANVPKGSKLVILNFQSNYPALSDYIIDELIANTVNDRVFSVVDRANLALVQTEMDFQLSGEVSDESAQAIGKKLGAQTIVSGAISPVGNSLRLRVRAIDVESVQIQGQFNRNIPNGTTITALMNSSSQGYGSGGNAGTQTAQGGATGGGNSGTAAGATQAPAKADPAKIPNGTYTFYPRPQATIGGVPDTTYLHKVVVSGNYLNVYFSGNPRTASGPNNMGHSWHDRVLQDLDNPSKSYKTIDQRDVDGYLVITFENVTARRFSLADVDQRPPVIFDEIILGEPDAQ
jgi:TolB-like protein